MTRRKERGRNERGKMVQLAENEACSIYIFVTKRRKQKEQVAALPQERKCTPSTQTMFWKGVISI